MVEAAVDLEASPSTGTLLHRNKYHIPVRYLQDAVPAVDDSNGVPEHETIDGPPESPILVFINPKSGGQCGPMLQKLLSHGLGEQQVLDISQPEQRPNVVLKALYKNLDAAAGKGDSMAESIKKRLRIVAAGGDGTAAWALSTVRGLGIEPPPPVGVIPLGTGNGISINLGWGHKTQPMSLWGRTKADKELEAVVAAEVRPLDCWDVSIHSPDANLIDELPHSMHKVDAGTAAGGSKAGEAKGDFWYYLTVGLDAEVAYRFHKLRETKPWLSPTRKANIFWYFWSTCRTGWFCCPQPLNKRMKLRQRVGGENGEWQDVTIPNTVQAIIFINLQSYTGSRDMWGLYDKAEDAKRGQRVPIYDDGLIEVIGLESAGKTFGALTNLWKRIHGNRLAQGSEFELLLSKPGGGDTHLRVDGEPWRQELPDTTDAGGPLKVHVKLAPPMRVLVNKDNLPRKNKFSRLAADAAGSAKSGERFESDEITVVASHPSAIAAAEVEKLEPELDEHGMHLLSHGVPDE